MKLLKLLFSQSGKIALTTAQAVTAAAVVGVGGLALMQFGGSSSDVNPDTVFSSQDEADVVYVAGAAGGNYEGVGYGTSYSEGGGTSIRAKLSKDMQLMDLDAQRKPEPAAQASVDRQEGQLQSYAMDGQTEGLGMGKNAAVEVGGGMGGDLSAIQQQIASIQAAAQQGAAQAKAGNEKAAQDSAKAAAAMMGNMGGGSGQWDMAAGMARAGGSNLNSAPLQSGQGAGGTNVRRASAGIAGGADKGDRLAAATRKAKFEDGYREATSGLGRHTRVGDNTLEYVEKVSAEEAGNLYRADNSAVARAFMGSGIQRVEQTFGDGSHSGLDATKSSQDFRTRGVGQIAAFDAEAQSMQQEMTDYETERKKLKTEFDAFIIASAAMIPAALLKTIPIWGWIAYAVLLTAYMVYFGIFLKHIYNFQEKWNNTKYLQKGLGTKYTEPIKYLTYTSLVWVGMALASVIAATAFFVTNTVAIYATQWNLLKGEEEVAALAQDGSDASAETDDSALNNSTKGK